VFSTFLSSPYDEHTLCGPKEALAVQSINSLFTNLLNIGLGVGVTVAAFFLMWGAFLYMSASGNPHHMERGKSAMVNALAGLAIVLSARIIAGLIKSAMGSGH
jgi:hypothetical protein